MVSPIDHWLRIAFGTIYWITFRGLSGFWGIGSRIPLRVLYGLTVPLVLVVPAHPLPVPVRQSFEFSMSFFIAFTYLGIIVLWYHIGWCFAT